jgi:hypothetical protein
MERDTNPIGSGSTDSGSAPQFDLFGNDQAQTPDGVDEEVVVEADILDVDGDGAADTILVDSDADGVANAVALDTDADGVIDAVVVDADGDQVADTAVFDLGGAATGMPSEPDLDQQPQGWDDPAQVWDDGSAPAGLHEHISDQMSGELPQTEISQQDLIEESQNLDTATHFDAGMNATYQALDQEY